MRAALRRDAPNGNSEQAAYAHLLTAPAGECFCQLWVPFGAEKGERRDERTGTDAGYDIVLGTFVAAAKPYQRSGTEGPAGAAPREDQRANDAVVR